MRKRRSDYDSDGLDELLGADGFAGVEAAVDPDDGLAFFGEGVGFGVG
jgi:hypothetical protein